MARRRESCLVSLESIQVLVMVLHSLGSGLADTRQMGLEWAHSCWMATATAGKVNSPEDYTHCQGCSECRVHWGFAQLCHIREFPGCNWGLGKSRQNHSCQSCQAQLVGGWTQLDPKHHSDQEFLSHRHPHDWESYCHSEVCGCHRREESGYRTSESSTRECRTSVCQTDHASGCGSRW